MTTYLYTVDISKLTAKIMDEHFQSGTWDGLHAFRHRKKKVFTEAVQDRLRASTTQPIQHIELKDGGRTARLQTLTNDNVYILTDELYQKGLPCQYLGIDYNA